MGKNDKKIYVAIGGIIIAGLLTLGAVITIGGDSFNTSDSSSLSSTDNDSESDDTTSVDNDSSSEDDNTKVQQAANKMAEKYKYGSVTYDKDNEVIKITPSDPTFTNAAVAIANGADNGDTSSWDGVTRSINELSSSITDTYGIHTPVAIVNPQNTSKILYEAVDDSTVYDFATDGNSE